MGQACEKHEKTGEVHIDEDNVGYTPVLPKQNKLFQVNPINYENIIDE